MPIQGLYLCLFSLAVKVLAFRTGPKPVDVITSHADDILSKRACIVSVLPLKFIEQSYYLLNRFIIRLWFIPCLRI